MFARAHLSALGLALLCIACGGSDGPADAAVDSDATTPEDATPDGTVDAASDAAIDAPTSDAAADADAGSACARTAPPAGGRHFVVVSHSFTAAGMQANEYEVLELDATGELTRPGSPFSMGRASGGEIVFTPDGLVGFVAQEDGSIGVFALGPDGAPTVLDAGFTGDFYAGSLVMDADGETLWILDSEVVGVGGGLYAATVSCEGALTDSRSVLPANLPYGLRFLDDGTAVVVAKAISDSGAGVDVHRLEPATLSYRDGSDAFGDDDFIVSSLAILGGGRHAVAADNCGFCGSNRLGVVGLGADALTAAQVVPMLDDPISMAASPFGDRLLVVSGFGNAFQLFGYDADAAEPLSALGEPSYVGARPQLPAAAVAVPGTPALVLVAENLGVRRVRFTPGDVADLGLFDLGPGTENVVGALGVAP